MRAQTRWTLLLAALAVTGWLALRAPSDGGPAAAFAPTVAAVDPTQTAVKKGASVSPARERQRIESAQADPFFPATAAPKRPVQKIAPVPVPVVLPPPSPPSAPPLPFTYFGRVAGPSGAGSVYIARGNDLLTVKAGEVIDGVYRVERITEEEIVFVYLPLDVRQALRIPS